MYSNKITEQQTTVALVVEALFALCTINLTMLNNFWL